VFGHGVTVIEEDVGGGTRGGGGDSLGVVSGGGRKVGAADEADVLARVMVVLNEGVSEPSEPVRVGVAVVVGIGEDSFGIIGGSVVDEEDFVIRIVDLSGVGEGGVEAGGSIVSTDDDGDAGSVFGERGWSVEVCF